MKSLILMNPVRRKRRKLSGAARASHQRRVGRRVRRNPVARTATRTAPRRAKSASRHHSPAMRAKISRAVKAANRRRSSRPVATRVRSVIRRVRSTGIRRSFRRSFRRSSGGGSGGSLSLKTLLSRNVLMTASGAISASFLTSWLLRTYGSRLPMVNTTWGRIGYKLAIPFAGAYAAKKFAKQHDLAHGMIIGGVVMAVNDLIATFNAPARAGAAPVAGVSGPADYASAMINGLSEGEEYSEYFDEDPDALGDSFDGAVDPLYSNTPAFTSTFA